MKYSTAVGRLRTVADELTSHGEWRDDLIVEAYVYGGLLDAPATLERVALAFVVDLPPEEVTWLAHPAAPEAAVSLLRFDKYPITWRCRPLAWAVWNHEIIGPVRFWSVKGGADETTLNALSDRRLDSLERSLPKDDETFVAQLRIERDAARNHLEWVVDSYHDRGWRKSHKGFGVYPEDHLWWATRGFLDLDEAVNKR
ncbi:hypothetical protein BH23ACT4_BH23ACT4_11130 [soil metagenome]